MSSQQYLQRMIIKMNSISLNDYNSKIKRVLITEQQIQEQIKIAGKKITQMYDVFGHFMAKKMML